MVESTTRNPDSSPMFSRHGIMVGSSPERPSMAHQLQLFHLDSDIYRGTGFEVRASDDEMSLCSRDEPGSLMSAVLRNCLISRSYPPPPPITQKKKKQPPETNRN